MHSPDAMQASPDPNGATGRQLLRFFLRAVSACYTLLSLDFPAFLAGKLSYWQIKSSSRLYNGRRGVTATHRGM